MKHLAVLTASLIIAGSGIAADADRTSAVSDEWFEFADAAVAATSGVSEVWANPGPDLLDDTDEIADRLRSDLLAVRPDECFLEAYGLAWVLWGDLRAVVEAPDSDARLRSMETMLSRPDIATSLKASDC